MTGKTMMLLPGTACDASFYDGMMRYSTLPGKVICRLVRNMDGEKNLRYLVRALPGRA